MFLDSDSDYVTPVPDSERTERLISLIDTCCDRVAGTAERPSGWTEESALAHWLGYLLAVAWARYPDDAQARAEEAADLGTYYRPDGWDDGEFTVRDYLYEIAEDWDSVPRLVSLQADIRDRGLMAEIKHPI